MAKKSVANGSLATKPLAKKIGGERGSGESCNTVVACVRPRNLFNGPIEGERVTF